MPRLRRPRILSLTSLEATRRNGEPPTARLILRDLVNASIGFEVLAAETKMPSKSLHRMLSERGNPSMDNLAAIFGVVRKRLGVELRARAVKAA